MGETGSGAYATILKERAVGGKSRLVGLYTFGHNNVAKASKALVSGNRFLSAHGSFRFGTGKEKMKPRRINGAS